MSIEFFRTGRGQVISLRPSHAEQLIARVFDVFDLACELQEVEAAEDILTSARLMMARYNLPSDGGRDPSAQRLVDAHYRLWELRYLAR